MDKIVTSHEDLIHDAQLDYYGKRLATCSSDRTIKIYDVAENGERTQVADLTGHDGPVWQIAWAHPRFGNILASCSYDRQVFVWKEMSPNMWAQIYKYAGHEQSGAPRMTQSAGESWLMQCCVSVGSQLNCMESAGARSLPCVRLVGRLHQRAHSPWFAFLKSIPLQLHSPATPPPCEMWPSLDRMAAHLLRYCFDPSWPADDDTWSTKIINKAHSTGCNAVSWAPAFAAGATASADMPAQVQGKRLVSGGSDNLVKIWRYIEGSDSWEAESELNRHTDWVRDVAWAPSLGAPDSMVASCSQDKKVIIWTEDTTQDDAGKWAPREIQFSCVIWRVSWSVTGNILAVSGGDNLVSLWKQNLLGDWEQIGSLSEESNTQG